MIVRIATEGQYRVSDDQLTRLEQLNDAVVQAAGSGDDERFKQRFADLLEFVRTGELLDDAHLQGSDAILPPPDVSLEEATRDFSGEGLFPG